MKIFKGFLIFLLVLLIGAIVYNYPKLNIIAGYAAKNMASTVFLTERSEQNILENDNNMPLISLASTEVEKNAHVAIATVFGFSERKAIYRDGLGAVLVNEAYNAEKIPLKPVRSVLKNDLNFPYGERDAPDTTFQNIDYNRLQKAVKRAFSQPEKQKTRSVLVVYKDHIITEQYIEGFDKNSLILGWSMTKSILGTLYGILEYRNQLNIEGAAPILDWSQDLRKEITLNNLLRMESGLAWDEDYTSISDVTRMLYLESDMTKVQLEKETIALPGEVWNYSSGTTNLLSGILRKHFATYQEYLNYPYKELIDAIGMHSMLLETDMAGNYVGSSYAWANTRDWAKFGLLYLHHGNWNGKQLFSLDWVSYVTKSTENSNGRYGAHFWLNANGHYPNVPRDMYSANGFQGQRVFIIPSKDLVVVRTGLADASGFDMDAFLTEIATSIQ